MLIRLTQVTAIFGIGHCFRNLIATTYSGNLSQADKHEAPRQELYVESHANAS